MATIVQHTRKVGGSIMVRIPKDIAEQEHIEAGELVRIDVRRERKDWFGALKGIGPFRREDKFDVD